MGFSLLFYRSYLSHSGSPCPRVYLETCLSKLVHRSIPKHVEAQPFPWALECRVLCQRGTLTPSAHSLERVPPSALQDHPDNIRPSE